jgi:error-prone DNA polymerase
MSTLTSVEDLKWRVPAIQKSELVTLAEIGALNFDIPEPHTGVSEQMPGKKRRRYHRRDALWQVERVARPAGPLLEEAGEVQNIDLTPAQANAASSNPSNSSASPLEQMTDSERLVADFRGTGMTVGPHPMAYYREQITKLGVRRASELEHLPNGMRVRIAGAVIARQRPGTAKGFVFLSLEDETGIANAIIDPDTFAQNRVIVVNQLFLFIEGKLQHQDNVISVKAETIRPLPLPSAAAASHDFH